ncbi:kinase-like protein [Cubamyces sp. BRFM 1775]|nr:kinase-like protein [Cubamyces sp. BRFM 1775]
MALSSNAYGAREYVLPYTVCGIYEVDYTLGRGPASSLMHAFSILDGTEVAMKLELLPREPSKRPLRLEYETAVYKLIPDHAEGFPKVLWSGKDGNCQVLILEMLGPTLDQLRRLCRGRFSLRTICMLADQMITRLEYLHSRGLVHGDIKPHNFAMGNGSRSGVVHLFDLEHAKMYIDPATGEHIPDSGRRHATGTVRYASIAAHSSHEVSRMDDLESLFYVLLEFYHGALPWKGALAPSWPAKVQRIGDMKADPIIMGEVLSRSPPEFAAFHTHCISLPYGATPDYALLRNLFRERIALEGWCPQAPQDNDGINSGKFDWLDPSALPGGTLLPEEYYVHTSFLEEPQWNPATM